MGTVYRQAGRNIWLIKYYVHGKPVYESSRTDNKTEATRLLKRREGAVASGEPLPRVGRLTVSEGLTAVLRDYEVNRRASATNLEYRVRLHLAPFFGDRYMRALTTDDINAYVDHRRQQGASNGTINRELAHLKRAFTLAIRARALGAKPHIPMLDEQNARSGFFERADLDRLCAALPPPLRPVMIFAYYTGWRIKAEILPLEWSRVDDEVVRLEPNTTKNRKGREFPYTHVAELKRLMAAQRKVRQGPFVFHDNGRRIYPGYEKTWRAACKAAGVVGKIPHDLRRTAVRNLVRAGVSEKTAMLLTGHKTRSVFDRYDIVTLIDLKQAASKLKR